MKNGLLNIALFLNHVWLTILSFAAINYLVQTQGWPLTIHVPLALINTVCCAYVGLRLRMFQMEILG